MEFASWVPEEVKERHRLSAPLEPMEKILTSEDSQVKHSWFLIEKRVQKLHNSEEAKKLYIAAMEEDYKRGSYSIYNNPDDPNIWNFRYKRTYDFLYGAFWMCSSAMPIHAYMLQDDNNNILRDVLNACQHQMPGWLKDGNRNNRQKELKATRIELKKITGFVKRKNLDLPLVFSGQNSKYLTDLYDAFNEQSRLLKTFGKDSPELSEEMRRIYDKHQTAMDMLEKARMSEILEHLAETLDFCHDYPYEFIKNQSSASPHRAESEYFAVLLGDYFRKYLGGPRDEHVAVFTEALYPKNGQTRLTKDDIAKLRRKHSQ